MPGPRAATAALLPAVLLAALAPWAGRGGAAAAPGAPNGTLEAELGRRWESLVARSLARLPAASQPKEAAVQSGAGDYLLGIKRLRRLYCNVGIGFHLQVLRDGRIGGVHADTGDSEWDGRAGRAGAAATASHASSRAGPPADTCLGLWAPGGGKGEEGTGETEVLGPAAWGGGGANHLGSWDLCAPGGRAPPPRPRPPGLPARHSSAFARGHVGGHGARGAAARDPGSGRGAAAAGHGAEGSESKPAHAGLWGPLGSPGPGHSSPEMGVSVQAQGPFPPRNDPRPPPRPAGALAGGAGRGEHLRRGQPLLRGHEQQGQAVRLGEYRGAPPSTGWGAQAGS